MPCTLHHAKHRGTPLSREGLSPKECWVCLQELVQRAHIVLDNAGIPYDSDFDETFSLPARIAILRGERGGD